MIHYHGTPITPRETLYELAGRSFCVSFADARDLAVCHEIGEGVLLDNGAFSFWRQEQAGRAAPDWDAWREWAEPWLDYRTTWAVLPDVIGGGVEENDALVDRFRRVGRVYGCQVAPVWHLHEPLERLHQLVYDFERVCFGSSGAYAQPGSDAWHRRVSEAFDDVADEFGRVPWIHMLRGLGVALERRYPFSSADSATVARNHAGSWRDRPKHATLKVAELDAVQQPPRWRRTGTQLGIVDQLEGATP